MEARPAILSDFETVNTAVIPYQHSVSVCLSRPKSMTNAHSKPSQTLATRVIQSSPGRSNP